MPLRKTDKNLLLLLVTNCGLFAWHAALNCEDIYYFFQLTVIAQVLVILNFFLSICLHQRKSTHKVKYLLSRFHLMVLSLQAIVVIGFWGLRIFFTQGILAGDSERTLIVEALSIWMHGGSLATMFYFIRTDQIVMQKNKQVKYLTHLFWGVPFLGLQYLRWYLTGEHIYGFLKYFSWVQLVCFEGFLYFIAVTIDYTLTLRHGLKLTIKAIGSQSRSLDELQKQKQEQDARQYLEQEKKIKKQRRE